MAVQFPIPDDVLASHIAVLGETGSGKTFDSKAIVEHLVAQGYRVCVLDTIKSDWWGMISSASGKSAGLPFRIIGGPRGHVPLHKGAGRAIGELVAKGALPLSIIDMADFEAGEPQHFFEDFARAIWRNIKGVLYLVIEEAHEIAPKERAGFGKENMAVYWAKKLATGSRTKGIRLIVASQRTQAVHNAVLGSCKTMIAHSLSLPADQKPVRDWLDANILDKSLNATIKDELAFLPTGTAWVCSAKARFFQKVKFPKIKTFDNTATPDKDATEFEVATAAVDPEELRSIIGDAVKEAEANDPAALKKEIARLTRLVDAKPAAAAQQPDPRALRDEYERGAKNGKRDGLDRAIAMLQGFGRRVAEIGAEIDKTMDELRKLSAASVPPSVAPGDRQAPYTPPPPGSRPAGPAPERPANPLAVGLTRSGQNIIDAMAWLESVNIFQPPRAQVAAVADRSPTSGGYGADLATLERAGLISFPDRGLVALTEAGRQAANYPAAQPTTATFHESLSRKLGGSLWNILKPVIDAYPNALSRTELAAIANRSATSGGYGADVSKLEQYGLIEYPARGVVRARSILFLDGR